MTYADEYCTYEEQYEPEHTYTFTGPCVVTGKPYSVTVKGSELFSYRNSKMRIQDAMPSLAPDDREFLQYGISPEAWDAMFTVT